MLIFTRRRDEAIMIGDEIQVTVLRAGKESVRIGIEAPPEVAVHRREIYDQIRQENQAAAQSTGRASNVAKHVRQWVSESDRAELPKEQ